MRVAVRVMRTLHARFWLACRPNGRTDWHLASRRMASMFRLLNDVQDAPLSLTEGQVSY